MRLNAGNKQPQLKMRAGGRVGVSEGYINKVYMEAGQFCHGIYNITHGHILMAIYRAYFPESIS